jgi:putative zinc finger/helix-turn-helix YgiT family protein
MKSPITGKDMRLVIEPREVTFRKEKFFIQHHSFLCEDSGEQYTTTYLDELNVTQIYNQYRDNHNLPFPDEIRNTREKYGLTSAMMAEILGFGVNIYRNYEKGEVPNESNARLIQMAQDPEKFRNLVELSDAISGKALERLLARIDNIILQENKIRMPSIEEYLMGDALANEYSGYRKPNLMKLTEMIVFFAHKVQPFKTKLNKLLFYSDFLHFKKTGFSISGTRYSAIDMGPVPENFNSIFEFVANKKDVNVYCKEFSDGGIGEQFKANPNRAFDLSRFSDDEVESIIEVATKFGNTTTKEMIKISHKEGAWQANCKNKARISYRGYGFSIEGI